MKLPKGYLKQMSDYSIACDTGNINKQNIAEANATKIREEAGMTLEQAQELLWKAAPTTKMECDHGISHFESAL